MRTSIFLSHNKADKPFVRRLATDLENQAIRYWLDEAEIKTGESLIEKIRDGIDTMDYLAVVLSPDSVASPWVQREVDVAMNQEIQGRRVKVLPIMYRECPTPGFLLGKKYADFTDSTKYDSAFRALVSDVGVVFNRRAFHPDGADGTLSRALDKTWKSALPLLSRPFHRPFQYIGMPIAEAARATGGTPNKVGNIIIDTADCHMCLTAEGNYISFVEVDLNATAPHFRNQEFDPEPILGAVSIGLNELELVRRQTHCHTYYDHKKRLKITVSCLYDEGPIGISFGSKYYGM